MRCRPDHIRFQTWEQFCGCYEPEHSEQIEQEADELQHLLARALANMTARQKAA